MSKKRPLYMVILVDIAGISMIIGAGLFGWIPGPGGIPLLLGGFGLLATNHLWAKKLLLRLKKDGLNVMDKIFVEHRVIVIVYDVVVSILLIFGAFMLINSSQILLKSFATMLIFVALGIFLGNRKRWHKFSRKNKNNL